MLKNFSHFTDALKFTVRNKLPKRRLSLVLMVCKEFHDVNSAGNVMYVM